MRPPISFQAERCDQCRRFKGRRWSDLLDVVAEGDGRRKHNLKDLIVWVLEYESYIFGCRYRWLSNGGIFTKLALPFHHTVNCEGLRKFWSQDCHRVIRHILVAWKSSSNMPPYDSVRNVDHEVDVDEFPHEVETQIHGNLRISSNVSTRNVNQKFEFCELPRELQGQILGCLPYEQVFQMKAFFSSVKGVAESDELRSKTKPSLTACYFFIKNGVWNWAGYDPDGRKWRLLPPLTFLPANCAPDPDLFKEYLICANEGLVCMNLSKSAHQERLIVFNPLSGAWKELSPLNYRRNPVLMHMLVDPTTAAYQVIVAGASNSLDEGFSRITEVYDSCTGMWKRTGDISGPLFALNEYQSGVYQNGKIFCIGFVEENENVGKGVLAYDVREGKWSSKWMHQLRFSMSASILQLVGSNGQVFLFSERNSGGCIEHCVEKLEWGMADGDGLAMVIQKKKTGGRGLEVYPEYVCVPYGDGQLCILNTVEHTGVVYDICKHGDAKASDGGTSVLMGSDEFPLQELPEKGFKGESLFSLNPMSFTIEPQFSCKVH